MAIGCLPHSCLLSRVGCSCREYHLLAMIPLVPWFLFPRCIASPCCGQNAPNGFIGDPIAACDLPQRLTLRYTLHDAGPLGARYLEGRRRWVDVFVFG
jgi:hypothetical protein